MKNSLALFAICIIFTMFVIIMDMTESTPGTNGTLVVARVLDLLSFVVVVIHLFKK